MRAMILPAPLSTPAGRFTPLACADVPVPGHGDDDLLIHVSVCGVCRTDLDVAEGRVVASRYPIIPGHQVVGRVAAVGARVAGWREGDLAGIAWIHGACGRCRWCAAGEENLCPYFESTGAAVDGGYAEYAVVRADFAHRVPDALDDRLAAPLLCAGAIGWRSLRLTGLHDGDPLGLVGFGASGHLVLQLARIRYSRSPIYVFARNPGERRFALELGADWAGDGAEAPPQPLGAAIDTTPAWKPDVDVLPRVMPGGRLVINAIRKSPADQSELLRLDYARDLWMERDIKSVANVTRADVREMLAAAATAGLRPTVEELPLTEANTALQRLRDAQGLRGAMVLRVAE